MNNKKKKHRNLSAIRQQPEKAATIAQVTQQQFSGPVPHPDILRQYNLIIPDAAERILIMAEKDAAHIHKMEEAAITYAAADQKRGQLCGLAVGLVTMLTAMTALYLGYSIAAATIGGTTVVGLVTVFVTGRIVGNRGQQ